MPMPLVSVGIPCFNRPQGLDRLLHDMTRQTFQDIEIVVSDDCSTDMEVCGVAQRYAASDARVRLFRQSKNIGSLPNHQFVKDKARGKYFMWAHDDDEFPIDYVEVCLRHFRSSADVVLVGPSCDRYFNGKYLDTYENYSSVGKSTYHRLRELMPDAFTYHWRSEQYWSGLCLLEAAPRLISEYCRSESQYFFILSERGALAHAPELTLIKHISQRNFDAYAKGSFFRCPAMLRYFCRDMQDCAPITCQMLCTIWKARKLTSSEKLSLMRTCLGLFARYPLRSEIKSRLPKPLVDFLRKHIFVAQ